MTNDQIRKKDKWRSSEQASRPRFGLRDSDFFCHQVLVVRVFLYAIPFRRRKPHSETKQMNANKRTLARCQSGSVQLSVMGALRFGRLATNASSLSGAKEQQLQQLTEQYKADKISAEEYFQQRAKILAEP